MADTNDILHNAEQQMIQLAKVLFVKFKDDAIADGKDFLQKTRDDLTRWVQALETKHLDKDDFESLVRGETDLAEMRALKQAGLAQITIDTFTNGVINILINAAFTAIKI